MTALTQISRDYFVEREGAHMSLSPESQALNQPELRRSSQPFSVMSEGKFRRNFNRHSFTRMR
jgi:hypothetical protein